MPGYNQNPITLSLPGFYGLVKKLVIANLAIFLALAVVGIIAPLKGTLLATTLSLEPMMVLHHLALWQGITYGFVHLGLLEILLNMLVLWFFGERLEANFGAQWLGELYFLSLLGGAAAVMALSLLPRVQASNGFLPVSGAEPALLAMLVAWAVFYGEQEVLLFFVVRLKVKYLVAITVLFDFGAFLVSKGNIVYAAHLGAMLTGWLYAKHAPRRGVGFGMSEGLYGVRNAWYRRKRKQAAKKFEVYMRDQSTTTHVSDKDAHRDPNDRRWMN